MLTIVHSCHYSPWYQNIRHSCILIGVRSFKKGLTSIAHKYVVAMERIYMNHIMRKPVSCHKRTTKAHISLHMCASLISAFVVRCLDSITSPVVTSKISRILLACFPEQTDLSLTWSQTPKTGFLVTWLT